MPNWTGAARSNYFHVKDEEAFRADMDRLGLTVISNEQGFSLLADQHDSGWPSSIYDDETDEDVEVDLVAEVAQHLAEGQVCVFVESGYEGLRYVGGDAVAVNSAGDTRRVSLGDIYDLAKEIAGPGVEISHATS